MGGVRKGRMSDEQRKPVDESACPGEDQVALSAVDGNGVAAYVRHTADHRIEAGYARFVRDGEPIGDEAVQLEHREGPIYAVKPILEQARKGPAKVATSAYRDGWDTIFGKKQPVGQA